MELDELAQGLQNLQENGAPPEGQPWLNMDNMMGAYGNLFSNDQGLGELLLSQLRANGVDTQAATEAMLRELLSGLVQDLNLLQQRLMPFISELKAQGQHVQDVVNSIDGALSDKDAISQQVVPSSSDMLAPVMNDIPPDMGGDMGAPAPAPAPAPDMGGDMGAPDVPPNFVPSDVRIKNIHRGYRRKAACSRYHR